MSSSPLASIVICNYNYDRFLGAAIDSAINQTHPHVEVIVVDDGSTDESREVMVRYGDRIIPILKPNEGHDTAVNDGFRASRGDLVCFLDADDALYTTAAARSAEALSAAGVVKVHWPLAIVDGLGRPDGRFLPEGALPSGDLRAEVITHGPQAYRTPPTSGSAWARSFLEQVCPIQPLENRAGTADDQPSMLAPLFGEIAAIECQGVYRAHGNNNYYWGKALQELAKTVRDYDRYCDILSAVCRRQGVAADPEQWRRVSWLHRLQRAISCIVGVVPEGDSFALAVEGSWGAGEWIDGRRQLQFPNCDGVYWGTPASDEEAIAELERLRRDGAGFLAIGWTAFWYCEYFSAWYRFIRDSFRCLEGRPISYGLASDVLMFIDEQCSSASDTLEIGCGVSTILFALKGGRHTCIVPDASEVARVRGFCQEQAIATDRVTFIVGPSERALPGLALKDLNLILIDGRHGFPAPFIDWFYTAPFLKCGGTLIIDDVHLWTCGILRDFLEAEPECALQRSFSRSVAFTKLEEGSETKEWHLQRYMLQRAGQA